MAGSEKPPGFLIKDTGPIPRMGLTEMQFPGPVGWRRSLEVFLLRHPGFLLATPAKPEIGSRFFLLRHPPPDPGFLFGTIYCSIRVPGPLKNKIVNPK